MSFVWETKTDFLWAWNMARHVRSNVICVIELCGNDIRELQGGQFYNISSFVLIKAIIQVLNDDKRI